MSTSPLEARSHAVSPASATFGASVAASSASAAEATRKGSAIPDSVVAPRRTRSREGLRSMFATFLRTDATASARPERQLACHPRRTPEAVSAPSLPGFRARLPAFEAARGLRLRFRRRLVRRDVLRPALGMSARTERGGEGALRGARGRDAERAAVLVSGLGLAGTGFESAPAFGHGGLLIRLRARGAAGRRPRDR